MIAEVCSYCGRKNPDQFPKCVECGTVLTDEELPEKPKSKKLALVLTLAFGPLGLFYSTITGGVVMVLASIPLFIFARRSVSLAIGFRLFCLAWAFAALKEQEDETRPHRQALRLLNEAASHEDTDREKAILIYEEVIRCFPNTSASNEAARNIEKLKQVRESHP